MASATIGLLKVEIAYPAAISHFRLPILSENQPEKTFNKLAVDSAMPSMRPIMDLFTPRIFDRKSGTRGYIISELTSIKKLTSPATKTFFPKPKNFFSLVNEKIPPVTLNLFSALRRIRRGEQGLIR